MANGDGDNVEATRMTLPRSYAATILETVLLPSPQFRGIYDGLVAEGFAFLPDRITAIVHVPAAENLAFFAATPSMTVVAPGSKVMSRNEESHEVASISTIVQGKQAGAIATRVKVGHNPFELLSFSLGEYNEDGEIVWTSVERPQLEDETASALAQSIGAPSFRSDRQDFVDGLSETEALDLARSTYQTLITDQQLNVPYRPAELRQLVDETPLVEKWALVQLLRYSSAFPAGDGEVARLKTVSGSSTSSSCQGCTSTSTSVIPVSLS